MKTGEVNKLDFKSVPRNDSGEIDLHRPFADEIKLKCKKCSGEMNRVKEVADVWYDSGAMPLAQAHWPFTQIKNEKLKIKIFGKLDYPADYIAEGMDQTRGWFYLLLAVAIALGKESPYKNVVSLGLINDKYGQKMSKSKGNAVEPWAVINKYGVDAVRWYFFTVNPPGETKNFDELEIAKAYRKFHALIWNSFVFLKTYSGQFSNSDKKVSKAKNVLDEWILVRLDSVKEKTARALDKYNIRDAALEIESLVDDLSRWYIRRSRRRLQKPENQHDYQSAVFTLRHVLTEVAKLSAPFVPFFAEELYRQLGGAEQSVHLERWPEADAKLKSKSEKLLKEMAEVRRLASIALAKRAEAGIKVRQPLAKLKVSARGGSATGGKNKKSKISKELLEILKDEINVKEIIFDKKINPPAGGEIELDTMITPELKEEGILRELVRMVQGLRQEAKLKPQDKIVLMLELPEVIRTAISKNEKVLKAEVGAKEVEYKKSEKFDAETSTKFDGSDIWLALRIAKK
ncbi:MAG: class I tRNA ligase family protein [bacterium]|nr:class I tRNA ligase family protein [bacterium]